MTRLRNEQSNAVIKDGERGRRSSPTLEKFALSWMNAHSERFDQSVNIVAICRRGDLSTTMFGTSTGSFLARSASGFVVFRSLILSLVQNLTSSRRKPALGFPCFDPGQNSEIPDLTS
jgi:hypothetical protein